MNKPQLITYEGWAILAHLLLAVMESSEDKQEKRAAKGLFHYAARRLALSRDKKLPITNY